MKLLCLNEGSMWDLINSEMVVDVEDIYEVDGNECGEISTLNEMKEDRIYFRSLDPSSEHRYAAVYMVREGRKYYAYFSKTFDISVKVHNKEHLLYEDRKTFLEVCAL